MPLLPTHRIGLLNGWLFMSVFILQMLVIMFAGKKVQARSHIPAEYKQSKFEKNIGVLANLIWLLILIYSVFLPLQFNTYLFITGLIVFIIGTTLLAAATWAFMSAPLDEPITTGVYRVSRHPMYLATFFICAGTGIATASWILILLSLITAYCFHQEALIEERVCLEQYGSGYRNYMTAVPRWLGFPRK